jgi:hypothetical protein
MSEWEEVAENTWRLELDENGYLYRYGSQIVHVPAYVGHHLSEIAESLTELRALFEEATFKVNGREGVRAIRNSDVGD